ncbi:hypothetical protein AYI69_g5464, partial [Smittium culicis]
MTPSKR